MRIATIALVTAAVAIGPPTAKRNGGLPLHASPGTPQGNLVCTADAGFRDYARTRLQFIVSWPDSVSQALRDSLDLPTIDTADVVAIVSDSLCALAGLTINRDLGVADSTSREIALIRLDTLYWAADTAITGGEWIMGFFLSASLDSVRGRLWY